MARSRSNPLALAVLACLFEKPMHPYEMAQTLRSRAKHESVRLNYGSLYGVVESLEKRELIRARATTREGRRPPRTIYEITADGEVELSEWMAEMVSVPEREYLRFEAALSFLHSLPPDEAVELLRQRTHTLELAVDQMAAATETAARRAVPRMFLIETEYKLALQRCELEFLRALVADIDAGDLEGLDMWRSWFEDGSAGDHGSRLPQGSPGTSRSPDATPPAEPVATEPATEPGAEPGTGATPTTPSPNGGT